MEEKKNLEEKEVIEELTLEEAFEKLEKVMTELEDREISLEDSFRKYQEGMRLLKLCNDRIDRVEKKILVMNGEGQFEEFR